MDPWIEELKHLIPVLLATKTPWIMSVMILTGVLLFVLVFVKLGDIMSFPNSNSVHALIVLILTLVALLAATIAARLILTPQYGVWPERVAPFVGLGVAGVVSRLITRAKYFRNLLALILSLAAAAGIMVITHAAAYAVTTGERSMDRLRDRQEETGDFLRD